MATPKVNAGLGFTRFVTLLALIVWLGGLAFIGIAAPAMFKVSRPLGPLMVGAILERFTPIIYVCGVLLLVGWLAEIKLPRAGKTGIWYWLQGGCTVLMIAIALYLGQSLMPRITAMQSLAIQQPDGDAIWPSKETKAEFDAAHKGYTSATKLVVVLGLSALFAFSLRTTAGLAGKTEADSI